MKRRDFLKVSASAVAAMTVMSELPALARCKGKKSSLRPRALSFRPDGKFKILQLTDTHYISGDPRSDRALSCVREMIEAEKPDLVIHTGDIIFGKPDQQSMVEILAPLAESGIPWAVTLGNHDAQFGSSRAELMETILAQPGCINQPSVPGLTGEGNSIITLSGPSGVERVFYLFDSGDSVKLKGEEARKCYDYIRTSQILWYKEASEKFTAANGGVPVHSMAFMHIPLREIKSGLESKRSFFLAGNNCEQPCPSRLNSGLFAQFREMDDVEAVVTGHDHDCDYVLDYGQIYWIYGRYSGGDTVYNHLGLEGRSEEKLSGARVFEFARGESSFRTWVRLQGGIIQQELQLAAPPREVRSDP